MQTTSENNKEVREWIQQHYGLDEGEAIIIAKQPFGVFAKLPKKMEHRIEADRHRQHSRQEQADNPS